MKTTSNTSIPLGISNNNWLNIRKSSTQWKGEVVTDNAFEKFATIEDGLRAAMKLLQTYFVTYKLNTVREIISRFAPATENNTANYINIVCNQMNNTPDEQLTYNKATIVSLVSAMAKVEVGKTPTNTQLTTAWKNL